MRSSGLVQSRMTRPALTQPGLAPKVDPDVWADSPWGMNDPNWGQSVAAPTMSDTLYMLKDMGMQWARVFVVWSELEVTQGTIVWNATGVRKNIDAYVAALVAQRIKILLVPCNAPNWAKQDPKKVAVTTISFDSASKEIRDSANGLASFVVGTKVVITGTTSNNATKTITAVAAGALTVSETLTTEGAGAAVTLLTSNLQDPTLYATFVTAMMNRYAGKIDAVQIGNEETITSAILADRDALRYAAILQAGANAVRAAQPTCKVVAISVYAMEPTYLESLLNLGCAGYADAWDVHPYISTNTAPNTGIKPLNWFLRTMYQTLRDHGYVDPEIWITEFGWPRTNEQQTNTVISAAQQVANLDYVMRSIMATGYVKRISAYVAAVDDGMGYIHKTNNYATSTPQPTIDMVGNLLIGDTALTMDPTWPAGRWPAAGVLIIESEQIYYASYSGTGVSGLIRGFNGTAAAQHADNSQITHQDLSASFKRSIYYRYQEIARAYPKLRRGQIILPPDMPPPGSPVTLLNGDMTLKTGVDPTWTVNSWGTPGGQVYDTSQYRSSPGSLKLVAANVQVRSGQVVTGVTSNAAYMIEGWIRHDGTQGCIVRITVDGWKAAGVDTSPSTSWGVEYYVFGSGSIWRKIRLPIVTWSNDTDPVTNPVVQLKIWLEVNTAVATYGELTGTGWFDDISISPLAL